MIKLPIVLAEHPEGWPAAVFGAVQTQRKLEAEALKDEAEGTAMCGPSCCFRRKTRATRCRPRRCAAT
jgi:type III restriction enzyme